MFPHNNNPASKVRSACTCWQQIWPRPSSCPRVPCALVWTIRSLSMSFLEDALSDSEWHNLDILHNADITILLYHPCGWQSPCSRLNCFERKRNLLKKMTANLSSWDTETIQTLALFQKSGAASLSMNCMYANCIRTSYVTIWNYSDNVIFFCCQNEVPYNVAANILETSDALNCIVEKCDFAAGSESASSFTRCLKYLCERCASLPVVTQATQALKIELAVPASVIPTELYDSSGLNMRFITHAQITYCHKTWLLHIDEELHGQPWASVFI